ncbi:CLUMA_CG004091, isoform A [Clunio marinus]|uniref:CLUMA_CG004091, isoform A n=1 Tax=Clunio marinus TaxID=568069 RepID=A0A1J1HQL4_9DIPT|nr:CLUMA_CG004091, isoform A [Clunio marinus]
MKVKKKGQQPMHCEIYFTQLTQKSTFSEASLYELFIRVVNLENESIRRLIFITATKARENHRKGSACNVEGAATRYQTILIYHRVLKAFF